MVIRLTGQAHGMLDPMTTPPIDETAAVGLIAELIEAESAGQAEPFMLALPPYSAFLLISLLQLAWRHPDLSEHIRDFAETAGRGIQEGRFLGTPYYDLLERGWWRELDVESR
jgi:hypothetical protein